MPLALAVVPNAKAYPNSYLVEFNTKSFKYHKPNCTWALKCTKHCISISKEEAIRRGGIACRYCGG